MSTRYYQKKQTKASKKTCERYQNFSERKKKGANMLLNDIEIFLRKKKTKSFNMVVNNIEIFQKMINKGYLSIEKNKSELQK